MIRIVGVQKNESPAHEFVLLQNQGSLRICLRGHILMSECALEDRSLQRSAHVFTDDVLVPAGMYVLLLTGFGESKWNKSKDGALIYHAFMNRTEPVWNGAVWPLHLLNTQHSHAERREPMLLMR